MATHPKITDSEMNYFQFKARQLLLLKKEDEEWQEYYLKNSDSECAACTSEKKDTVKESKTIGIQVSSRTPINNFGRKSLQPQQQHNAFPEALHNIRIKLENIDLALSKMFDASHENERKKKFEDKPVYKSVSAPNLKSLEEQRKLTIQKSLKASLEKLKNSSPRKPKKLQFKNTGYFIPHELQQKRAAARRAYLASLSTVKPKPKISQNPKQDSKKVVQSSQKKKDATKATIKPKKKAASKSKQEKPVAEATTLIETIEADEEKDENIEYAVDGILDDLLREAAIDLNKIKQRKKERKIIPSVSEKVVADNKEKPAPLDLLKSQEERNTIPKMLVDDPNNIMKIKLFLDSPEESQKEKQNKSKVLIDDHRSTFDMKNSKQLFEETDAAEFVQPKISYEITDPPKFVCGVSHVISIDPKKAKEISLQRDRFWRYLKNISRAVKGNSNPWIFCNTIAESILDDCINDVAEELGDVPTTLIKELYNQEFMQQVEFRSGKKA